MHKYIVLFNTLCKVSTLVISETNNIQEKAVLFIMQEMSKGMT